MLKNKPIKNSMGLWNQGIEKIEIIFKDWKGSQQVEHFELFEGSLGSLS